MIKAIIVDDEKASREVLRNYLKEYCTFVNVIAMAGSVKTAYRAIIKHRPGLVFLDIELRDGTGFDLIKKIERVDFRVIFVSEYSEHAVKAFRCNAVDYLLKPVNVEELVDASLRVKKELLDKPGERHDILELLKSVNPLNATSSTLVIPNLKGFEVLRISEIILCKADGYCTNFHLTGGRRIVSSKNLKYYELLLCNRDFARVHNSYVVNLRHVHRCTRQGEIMLTEDHSACLGDAYKEKFISRIQGK